MGTWSASRTNTRSPVVRGRKGHYRKDLERFAAQGFVRARVDGEMIDLDHTTRTREFGTLGLAQTLKQLRDSGHKFPIYDDDNLRQGSFAELGVLKFHRDLDVDHAT